MHILNVFVLIVSVWSCTEIIIKKIIVIKVNIEQSVVL